MRSTPDVDDDTYEQMKAGGAHKFFGVLSLMMLIVGIAAVALFVYRLVIGTFLRAGGREGKEPACRRICHGDRYFQI